MAHSEPNSQPFLSLDLLSPIVHSQVHGCYIPCIETNLDINSFLATTLYVAGFMRHFCINLVVNCVTFN